MHQTFKIFLVLAIAFTMVLVLFQTASNDSCNSAPLIIKYQLDNVEAPLPDYIDDLQLRMVEELGKQSDNIIVNAPLVYLDENAKLPSQFNKTCAKFPKLIDLQFTNDLWQTQRTINGSLQLLNAYFDYRNITNDKPGVRIITMYDQFFSNATFYCQFWYDQLKEPTIVQSEKLIWIWYRGWGGNTTGWYHPYIVTCLLPDKEIPMSVSVVAEPCENSSNNLRIYQKTVLESEKKDFVVCVKGLNFPYEDYSIRLIEWIELLFILGADKINFYKFHVNPTIEKVLEYYTRNGRVEVTPTTIVGGTSNIPYLQNQFLKKKVQKRRLQEVIPYNDCLYKHLQEYKFVILLDTDEVIVPATGTWNDLIKEIKNENKTSYIARNVYFLDSHQHEHEWFEGIPKFLHMLQHVYRAENYTKAGSYVKGFHDTSRVVALHNHFPVTCLGGCKHLNIELEYAHLQHYRSDCVKDVKNCESMRENSVRDDRLWHYKDALIRNVLQVLANLDMLKMPEM